VRLSLISFAGLLLFCSPYVACPGVGICIVARSEMGLPKQYHCDHMPDRSSEALPGAEILVNMSRGQKA
jgi:hypothetical protein